ncbi:MAG: FecR domain-containing protein, partial [Rhodospirillales bacterium]|nr:FecR domain-containing protein [Rhodospirillales bacterium]
MYGTSGCRLPNTAKIALALTALVTIFLTPFSSAMAERVGRVTEVQATAYGQSENAPKVQKFLRDGVVMQETLETVPDGGIAVQLIDETILTLGGNTSLTVDELVFDPATREGNSVLKLVAGTYYYVSGKMHKKGIQIETPVATIGIRGTKLLITIGDDGRTTVGVISGAAKVTSRQNGKSSYIDVGESVATDRSGNTTIASLADVKATDLFVVKAALKGAKDAAKKAEKDAKNAGKEEKVKAKAAEKVAKAAEKATEKVAKAAERVAEKVANAAERATEKAKKVFALVKAKKSRKGAPKSAFKGHKDLLNSIEDMKGIEELANFETAAGRPNVINASFSRNNSRNKAQFFNVAATHQATDFKARPDLAAAIKSFKGAAKDAVQGAAQGAVKDAVQAAAVGAAKGAAQAAAKDAVQAAAVGAAKG